MVRRSIGATTGSRKTEARQASVIAPHTLMLILHHHRMWLETAGGEGRRAALANVRLDGQPFWSADLRQADLRGADLRRANMDHAKLGGADLRGADLAGASLWSADLHDADLRQANLQGAKLDHADLRGTRLGHANLREASLWGAHLERADLRGATGLTGTQLQPLWMRKLDCRANKVSRGLPSDVAAERRGSTWPPSRGARSSSIRWGRDRNARVSSSLPQGATETPAVGLCS
jgi:uncharacterized protein YjbI with pentapeptide repeats